MTGSLPRLLVVMGSGETSPTMSKVHRDIFGRLGSGPVPAVLLDTPFGFQENADDISSKAMAYFRESVNREVTVASYRSADEVGSLEHETTLARLREARWVFAGPGSPSYALRQWRGTQVPALLADKLRSGGCVTFASAAAVTLGVVSLPVYEIYKVGELPHWLEGLDLIGEIGVRATVIPHFNNAEGGHHDTRYCYMGERRLTALEAEMPEGAFVLGVDEHTACVFDLDEATATVHGLGVVTVRSGGSASVVEAGQTVSIRCLAGLATDGAVDAGGRSAGSRPDAPSMPAPARSPLMDDVALLEAAFVKALADRDAPGAVSQLLALDDLLVSWSRDTLQSDELDRARATMRSMVVRLGEAATSGVRDPREAVSPFVEALLDARNRARAEHRWADADIIRDGLLAGGVEVHDTPSGTAWQLSS